MKNQRAADSWSNLIGTAFQLDLPCSFFVGTAASFRDALATSARAPNSHQLQIDLPSTTLPFLHPHHLLPLHFLLSSGSCTRFNSTLAHSQDPNMASFSLGCHDIHGNPLAQNIPVGQERNRRFVPANDPRFNNSLITPNNLIVYSAIDQVSLNSATNCNSVRNILTPQRADNV